MSFVPAHDRIPTGVGLGLRAGLLQGFARGEADNQVAFVEISPENYMHRGGRVPQRLHEVASRFPVISHGLMMSVGGTDPFDDQYFATLKEFLDEYDPPWHSDHLCFSTLDGVALHDLLPVPFTSATARRIADRIREAADRLQRPIAIENISWYMPLGCPVLDETEFIGEILERADCGLLLDVNNVFVNAVNHGFDALAWLDRIPLDRVVQLHVAGHERYGSDLLLDTHGAAVRNEVFSLMARVVARIGPLPVVLERDNAIPPLSELLEEVSRLDASYRAAVELRAHREQTNASVA